MTQLSWLWLSFCHMWICDTPTLGLTYQSIAVLKSCETWDSLWGMSCETFVRRRFASSLYCTFCRGSWKCEHVGRGVRESQWVSYSLRPYLIVLDLFKPWLSFLLLPRGMMQGNDGYRETHSAWRLLGEKSASWIKTKAPEHDGLPNFLNHWWALACKGRQPGNVFLRYGALE